MERTFDLTRREPSQLPPEKLYAILRGIWPEEIAYKKYVELTGLKPPKEEP